MSLHHLAILHAEMLQKRESDAKKYAELDRELCMICHSYGPDKRSFTISCLYDVSEVIPEALDMHKVDQSGYYLLVCKACRSAFLSALAVAAAQRRKLRETPLDSDGDVETDEGALGIFVRINGASACMTADQFEYYKSKKEGKQ